MANVLKSSAASDMITKLYLNEDFADVHFQFDVDDDVQMVPANKLLLAALSPVFHTMFYGSLKEGSVVNITDADADSFKEFLQFFYLGKVTLTMENIECVVRLADKYDVLEAINACVTFLETQLTIDNIVWGLQLAKFLNNRHLIKFCEKKIAMSSKVVFASDEFKRCDKNILMRILELDGLRCKEIDVLQACLTWAKYSCAQNGLDETQGQNLKTQIDDCLKLIRYGMMTIEEFTTFAKANNGIFTQDEFMDIVFTLTTKNHTSKAFFVKSHRQLIWNESEVLLCTREVVDESAREIHNPEVALIETNQEVLLGKIYCAPVVRDNLSQSTVNVTITEIREVRRNFCNNITKEILYKSDFQTGPKDSAEVILDKPIHIKANVKYEICLKLATKRLYIHEYSAWSPTIVSANGLKIQFHRDPSICSYDTATSGWIQSLGLNQLETSYE